MGERAEISGLKKTEIKMTLASGSAKTGNVPPSGFRHSPTSDRGAAAGLRISLSKGLFAKVDACDFANLNAFNWHAVKLGGSYYAVRKVRIGGKRMNSYMHREIMLPPDSMVVDHINHDTLDNTRSNLRVVTYSVNIRNRKHPSKYWSRRSRIANKNGVTVL